MNDGKKRNEMDQLRPMLLTTLKNYSKEQFLKDVVAGIVVAIIALPLSIALALASGVGAGAGDLYCDRGRFCDLHAGWKSCADRRSYGGLCHHRGRDRGPGRIDGLAVATIMAGIILILMGLFRFGALIKFIPFTITTGFTSGIAVTIVIGQLKDFSA